MKRLLLVAMMLLATSGLKAQEGPAKNRPKKIPKDSIIVDSNKAIHQLITRSLSTVATGVGDAGSFATYGSFEPVNGAYKFNIYGMSGKNKPYFYSFSATGKIVGDNTGVLFNNSKFNSNTTLSGKIHIPIQGGTFEAGKDSHLDEVMEKVQALKRVAEAKQATALLQIGQRVDSVALLKAKNELQIAETELKSLRDSINTAFIILKDEKYTGASAEQCAILIAKLNPKLEGKVKKVADLKADSSKAELLTRDPGNLDRQIGKARFLAAEEFNKKRDSLYATLKATGMSAAWISIVGSYARTKYNTFDGALPFSEQIKELNYNVFNIGLELNWYIKTTITSNKFKNKTLFFNVGAMYKRANDVDEYSTWEVSKSAKYTLGDSTNSLSKKYSVYSDKITEYKALRLYGAAYYYLSKSGNAALHFFPDVEFRNSHVNPFNLGLGFIFAVKKKDNSVLNVELYSKFNDVGKALPQSVGNSFIKRNEIGLNFSVPVNLLL